MTTQQKSDIRFGKWFLVGAAASQVAGFALLLWIIYALSGCSHGLTVIPKTIISQHASADGNKFNSGDVSYDADGAIKTNHWLERYDAMLEKYGARFVPPVKPGDRKGIVAAPPYYRVTAEVSARFTRMNLWRKADQSP